MPERIYSIRGAGQIRVDEDEGAGIQLSAFRHGAGQILAAIVGTRPNFERSGTI